MKYFYKLNDDESIKALYKGSKVQKNCIEITKEDYERYKEILASIEEKEGYQKLVTLYVDFTFEVEYIPVEEE